MISLKFWRKNRCLFEILSQPTVFFKNWWWKEDISKMPWLTPIRGTSLGWTLGKEKGSQKKVSEMQEGMFIKENSKYMHKFKQTLAVEKNNI